MGNSVSETSDSHFKSENPNKPLYTDIWQYFLVNSMDKTMSFMSQFFIGNQLFTLAFYKEGK